MIIGMKNGKEEEQAGEKQKNKLTEQSSPSKPSAQEQAPAKQTLRGKGQSLSVWQETRVEARVNEVPYSNSSASKSVW